MVCIYVSKVARQFVCAGGQPFQNFQSELLFPLTLLLRAPKYELPALIFPCSWKLSFLMHTHTHDAHVDEKSSAHKWSLPS